MGCAASERLLAAASASGSLVCPLAGGPTRHTRASQQPAHHAAAGAEGAGAPGCWRWRGAGEWAQRAAIRAPARPTHPLVPALHPAAVQVPGRQRSQRGADVQVSRRRMPPAPAGVSCTHRQPRSHPLTPVLTQRQRRQGGWQRGDRHRPGDHQLVRGGDGGQGEAGGQRGRTVACEGGGRGHTRGWRPRRGGGGSLQGGGVKSQAPPSRVPPVQQHLCSLVVHAGGDLGEGGRGWGGGWAGRWAGEGWRGWGDGRGKAPQLATTADVEELVGVKGHVKGTHTHVRERKKE